MEALNHAISLNEQIHAQLTLLASQRYESLSGSPAEVARRLLADSESVAANLNAVRHSVAQACAAAKRIDRAIGQLTADAAPGTPKAVTIVTCETVSPPPHVRPPEAGFDDVFNGVFGRSQFRPKRESDGPQPVGKQHPDLR